MWQSSEVRQVDSIETKTSDITGKINQNKKRLEKTESENKELKKVTYFSL